MDFTIRSLADIVGNKLGIEYVKKFLKTIQSNDKLIIVGPSGIGKTKCVELLCQELNYEIIKIDSANCEDSKDFLDRLSKLHQWKDMFTFQEQPKRRILVLDEMETLIKVDRNIPSTLIKFWNQEEIHLPCIIIGQYEADKKIGDLKKKCNYVSFYRIQDNDIFLYLKSRIPKNKIKLNDLMKISESANGSIYAAIQSLTLILNSNLHKKVKTISHQSGQDTALTIDDIFNHKNLNQIYLLLSEDPWIHPLKVLENAPKAYTSNNYKQFLKEYLYFEEWIYIVDTNNEMPIGFLSLLILYYNKIHNISNVKLTMEFTKLLSYISTQKKLQRNLYEKTFTQEVPISEIGYYWIHQMKK